MKYSNPSGQQSFGEVLADINEFLNKQRKVYREKREVTKPIKNNDICQKSPRILRSNLKVECINPAIVKKGHNKPSDSSNNNTNPLPTNIISLIRVERTKSEKNSHFRKFKIRKIQNISDLTIERKLHSKNDKLDNYSLTRLRLMDSEKVIEFVNSQTIGRNLIIPTPFGQKLKLYCDYTASGQDVKFILDEISKIEELYANTHTESSYAGAYMNHLLHEAEASILRQFKASTEDYFIIEGGSGSTYGIEAAQKILGTYIPPKFKQYLAMAGEEYTFEAIKDNLRSKGELPLVVVTTYEHHSNEITWRRQLCDVVDIGIGEDGRIDFDHFEKILKENYDKKTIIASLSAGSNVTGIKTDVQTAARLCKKYGVPSFFDYAAVGPYVPIDLSKRAEDGSLLIDGIYLSPHKFLGGPGSCGLLIMNKYLYDLKLSPTHGGGGTFTFVGPQRQDYYEDISAREKSGTPGVLQIIKCAFALELKGILQTTITKREHTYNSIFFERMTKNKNFVILGLNDPQSRVGIVSFLIKMDGPEGMRYMHYSLASRLLSDIFGIQARSGCFCAAIYGHYLFQVDEKKSDEIRSYIVKNDEIGSAVGDVVKPGSTRVSLHYSMTHEELDYLMFALEFLCDHGPRFLPLYTFESRTAEWTNKSHQWLLPKFGLGYILREKSVYAKDESSRVTLFERQKEEAIELLSSLPESKGYDSIPELGSLFNHYVEKGNITDRKLLEYKIEMLQKKKRIM